MLQKSPDPKDTTIISAIFLDEAQTESRKPILVDYYGTFDYEYFFWDSDATTKSRLLSHLARG